MMIAEFEKYKKACQKFPKFALLACALWGVQFFVLWIFTHVEKVSLQGGGLGDTGKINFSDSILDVMMTFNFIPTFVISLSFVFFYTSLLTLAICMVNHLEKVFQFLSGSLLQEGGEDEATFNHRVKEILVYAHQSHIRIIK